MKFTRKVTYPQIAMLNGRLTVPGKRVTYTCRIGRLTLSAAYQQQPTVPDAFKDDHSAPGNPAAIRITTTED